MKKHLVLLLLIGVLLIGPVQGQTSSNSTSSITYGAVSLKTVFLSQDPYPADPSGYMTLLFKLENWGTAKAENVFFELVPQYPFSLDPGVDATIELGTVNPLQTNTNAILLRYKVKVDEDAVDGDNEIGIKYGFGDGSSFYTKTFNISVSNPKTDFDIIVQSTTSSSTTLAIANIGSNTAYSVVVRIPDQQTFVASGISATILGNLNAGDYTLTSFQISSSIGNSSTGPQGFPGRPGMNASMPSPASGANASMSGSTNLQVEISYTDELGIRRTIGKEVKMASSSGSSSGMQLQQSSQQFSLGGGLNYIIIGVVGIAAIAAFFKLRGRKKK